MRPFDDGEERMIICRAKQGDKRAYEDLIRRYQLPIYRLCFVMTGAPQSADDLSQETFVKAFFALSGFEEDRSFYSWVRRIAVNTALNYLKARKREKPLNPDLAPAPNSFPSPGGDSPVDTLERKLITQKLRAALRTLPSDQRAIFILRVQENLSYRSIADILKIPPGTVMSRLNRARAKLRTQLAEFISRSGR